MRLGSALLGITAILAIGLVPVSPAQAEPDIKDVEAKVDRLYHEAEQASERYNDAKIDLDDLRKDLAALRADEQRQSDRLDAVREEVADSILRGYQGESISTVGQVVVSDDPSAFLGQLSTMSGFNDLQDSMFDDYSTELVALDLRRAATAERVAEIAETTDQLEAEKSTIDSKLADAKDLLADLEAEERERLLSVSSRSSTTRMPAAVPASGRAAAAVSYAMAQVGDAYVYGATGESAFDCSGLTMRAWGAAGVGLPHSSSAQYGSGAHISASALQPGDLVFYYSPISHVGMYIGNGMIVHAANPGTGVQVTGLYSMPYVGAVRPG
jgi:cell wall-associated NlpC family hydrolase